jgi:uncharacterized membrane protein
MTALAYGWKTFRANARPMLVVVLVPIVVQLVIAIAGRVLIHSVAKWFLFQIVGIVGGAIAGIGVPRMALMISAGETPDVGRAFRSERWGSWVAFSVAFGLLEGVGLVLCVIPGVLFLAFFGLAPYFFLDRGMGIAEALRASRQAIVARELAFPVLLAIVVGVIGAVVFVVGALVTQAVAALALAYLYRSAIDEPVDA